MTGDLVCLFGDTNGAGRYLDMESNLYTFMQTNRRTNKGSRDALYRKYDGMEYRSQTAANNEWETRLVQAVESRWERMG